MKKERKKKRNPKKRGGKKAVCLYVRMGEPPALAGFETYDEWDGHVKHTTFSPGHYRQVGSDLKHGVLRPRNNKEAGNT